MIKAKALKVMRSKDKVRMIKDKIVMRVCKTSSWKYLLWLQLQFKAKYLLRVNKANNNIIIKMKDFKKKVTNSQFLEKENLKVK